MAKLRREQSLRHRASSERAADGAELATERRKPEELSETESVSAGASKIPLHTSVGGHRRTSRKIRGFVVTFVVTAPFFGLT